MKKLQKLFSILLALSMTAGALSATAFATEPEAPAEDPAETPTVAVEWPDLQGEKTATLNDRETNLYDIELTVPGADVDKTHDEIIVMFDGSDSISDSGAWPSVKKGLNTIASTLLDGSGNTQLTLMTFGISPNIAEGYEHVMTAGDMEENLTGHSGGMLYGRSATNCQGAFDGIRSYIEHHDDDLRNAYVLFISDGQSNTNSVPENWMALAEAVNHQTAKYYLQVALSYGCMEGEAPVDVLEKTFGEENAAILLESWNAVCEGEERAMEIDDLLDEMTELENLRDELATAQEDLADLEEQLAAEEEAEEEEEEEESEDAEDAEEEEIEEEPTLEELIDEKKDEIEALEKAIDSNTFEDVEDLEAERAALEGEKAAVLEQMETAAQTVEALMDAETEEGSGVTMAQKYVRDLLTIVCEKSGCDDLSCDKFDCKDADVDCTDATCYEIETAFMDYDNYNDTLIQDLYYVMLSASAAFNTNNNTDGVYAAETAAEVAAMEEVAGLYMVRYGYGGRSDWMTAVEGTTFVQSDSVNTLASTLKSALSELAKTPYNDVSVVDYMSEWVALLPETIQVVDNNSGEVLAELDEDNSDPENNVYVYKWTDEALCAEKAPIVLELVDPADYADGGDDVIGNTEGDIWKITWNLKDGPLYRSDNFSLCYQVTVDTVEDDFEYDTWYPANGNTTVEYTDENGEETEVEVEVPEVIVPSEKKDKDDDDDDDDDEDRKPIVTIPDELVPVAPAPEETVEEEVVEIPEEEVPLADVPKTGDISALWLALSALSGTGLAGVSILNRKKRDEE